MDLSIKYWGYPAIILNKFEKSFFPNSLKTEAVIRLEFSKKTAFFRLNPRLLSFTYLFRNSKFSTSYS
jgi:hypothetical protein